MKIYAIYESLNGETTYLPSKRDALKSARARAAEMAANDDGGFTEVIEIALPRKRDAAYMCAVIASRGGSFAEDQHVIWPSAERIEPSAMSRAEPLLDRG